MGPDDIPRRWVASPMAMVGSDWISTSGSEEHTESKHGALSIDSSVISSLDVYIFEDFFWKAAFGIW